MQHGTVPALAPDVRQEALGFKHRDPVPDRSARDLLLFVQEHPQIALGGAQAAAAERVRAADLALEPTSSKPFAAVRGVAEIDFDGRHERIFERSSSPAREGKTELWPVCGEAQRELLHAFEPFPDLGARGSGRKGLNQNCQMPRTPEIRREAYSHFGRISRGHVL